MLLFNCLASAEDGTNTVTVTTSSSMVEGDAASAIMFWCTYI